MEKTTTARVTNSDPAMADARLIGVRYRLALVGRFAALIVLCAALCGALLLWALTRRLGLGYAEDLSTLSDLHAALPGILGAAAIIQMAVVGALTVLLLLCWTHAISGPLVRVRRTLRALASGQPADTLRFRATDELHPLAAALQRLISAQAHQRQMVQDSLAKAAGLIEACARTPAHPPGEPTLRERRMALHRVYEDVQRYLAHGDDS